MAHKKKSHMKKVKNHLEGDIKTFKKEAKEDKELLKEMKRKKNGKGNKS